ncbi:MAG: magnesium chelatase, partial [Muribaculaceae bacterium]|nr:magnesium chelatase [Muribaculaceae bacterium]
MLIKTFGAAVTGIDAITITIEVAVSRGYSYSIVGLPDTAIKESNERVRSAMRESGFEFPRRGVVVNLAPADVRKEGSAYDLPIAIGVLTASEEIHAEGLEQYMMMGELSLDGSLLPIKGVLPMAIEARRAGFKAMIVPKANATEAAVVNDIVVYGFLLYKSQSPR